MTVEELVRECLPLVDYLVAEALVALPRHVLRDDLASAGRLALTRAAQAYDSSRGVPFAAYAANRIRGAIVDELRSLDWASRSVRLRARRRDAAHDELAIRLGRTPTREELADHLGVSVSDLQSMDDDVHRSVVLSIQGVGPAVEGLVPEHVDSPDSVLLERERQAYLRDAVAVLPERLRAVVIGLFFEERTVAELAKELNVTESRVSQMRSEALILLRDGMNSALEPGAVPAPARPGGAVARRREAYFAAVAAHSDYRTRLSVPPAQPATWKTA
jgi:RNA polymerase sigma factor for flagellar operon FliA